MAWSQAALVLSHGHTAPVYGPGRQAGACARDAGAAHPATLAAQPGTGDTLTNEKSQIPPDLVVKSQRIDITDVNLWLI